jgi:indole-3-glycerol phosphate synthase
LAFNNKDMVSILGMLFSLKRGIFQGALDATDLVRGEVSRPVLLPDFLMAICEGKYDF